MPSRRLAALFVLAGLAGCGEPAEPRGAPLQPTGPATTPPVNIGPPAPTLPDSPPTPLTGGPVLTPAGYGPVRIGMTRAEVERLTGPLTPPSAEEAERCHVSRPVGATTGLYYMFEEGRLSRISLEGRSEIRTAQDLGLGDPETRARAAYPGAAMEGHEYVPPPASYLTSWDEAAKRGVRVEIGPDERVSAIHVGGPVIRYTEACS